MRRLRAWMAFAGAAAWIPILVSAGTGPTRVGLRFDADSEAQTPSIAYRPPDYVATPGIISRVGEILGAIDSPQKRNELAEQWLQYSRQVIAKDLEYRRQWLDLQRQQLSQRQEMEQLRLEVARLQVQVEELRARNAQLERENLRTPSRLGPEFDGPSSAPAPQAPALK